jgi:hypothetical protein
MCSSKPRHQLVSLSFSCASMGKGFGITKSEKQSSRLFGPQGKCDKVPRDRGHCHPYTTGQSLDDIVTMIRVRTPISMILIVCKLDHLTI